MVFLVDIFYSLHRFFVPRAYPVETFTFYIPAPPQRKNGYWEREYDQYTKALIASGREIVGQQICGHNGFESQGGMWIQLLLRPTRPGVASQHFEGVFAGLSKLNSSSPQGFIHDEDQGP